MTKSINVKINETILESMNCHEEINWSGVVRSALINKLEELNTIRFDKEKAKKAFINCKKLRETGVFRSRKTGAEIVREWRNKRR